MEPAAIIQYVCVLVKNHLIKIRKKGPARFQVDAALAYFVKNVQDAECVLFLHKTDGKYMQNGIAFLHKRS